MQAYFISTETTAILVTAKELKIDRLIPDRDKTQIGRFHSTVNAAMLNFGQTFLTVLH